MMTTGPEALKPTRRVLAFESVDEAVVEARRLLDVGYERAGAWSLQQNCDHLSTFMRGSLEGYGKRLVPWPLNGMMRRVLLSRKNLDKPMPAGLRAPAFLQPSTVEAGDGEAVERFADLIRRVNQRHREGGLFHRSPIFGRMSPDLWLAVHRKHAEHHLGFLVPAVEVASDVVR